MATHKRVSTKRTLITKANKRIVVTSAVTAFIVVFTLVAANTLVRQMIYQNRVISARKASLEQAEASLAASGELKTAYDAFIERPRNLIGGNSAGNGPNDGNNAKIIIDSLPSGYNFPALTTSIEKLVIDQGLEFVDITATDDSILQQENISSATPQPIEIPFEFSVKGGYTEIQALIASLERSIRPFQILSTGLIAEDEDGSVTLTVSAKTFFQPAKNLDVTEEVVQ